jgi:hypothetical protein
MAKLESDKRPAVVRVQTMPKGEEIVALCEKHHWKVIVGIEPDQPEDLSDIDLLLRGPAGEPPARSRHPGSAAMIIALAEVARSSRTAVQSLERMEAQSLHHANRRT